MVHTGDRFCERRRYARLLAHVLVITKNVHTNTHFHILVVTF